MTPLAGQVHPLCGDADTSVVPAGSVSETTGAGASDGPALVAVIV